MGIFYRNQRVEVQYLAGNKVRQTVIYDHANQVEIEKVTENGPFLLCIKFMKDDALTIDRYNLNELIRFRLNTCVPKKVEMTKDGAEITTEVNEDSADENYDN